MPTLLVSTGAAGAPVEALGQLRPTEDDEPPGGGPSPRTPQAGRIGDEASWRAGQDALEHGLEYLALRQAETEDGSFPKGDGREWAPMGITALGALAFMAAGHSPGRGPYGDEVARAIDYLIDHTDLSPESPTFGYVSIGGDEKSKTHGHGFATLALAEAYGMSPRRSERLERALVAAVRLIERIQGTEGGWYYEPRVMALHEGSVTVCLVQALRAARNSGIQVDGGVIARAEDYLLRLQNPDGLFRYDLDETSQSTVALTAAGIATLNMAGRYDTGVIQDAVDAIWSGLTPATDDRKGSAPFPFYRRLYIAQAFWQLSDTSHFERWFPPEREHLVRRQRRDGSWNDPRWGECYATAVNCLVLAIPEGLLPIFQR